MLTATKLRYDNFINCFAARSWLRADLAVIDAGFAKSCAKQTAYRLLTTDYCKRAIAKIQAEIKAKSVATRVQRQEYWTETYQDTKKNDSDRLRASELLGKSECDFIEKSINLNADIPTDPIQYKLWLQSELERLKAGAKVIESYDKSPDAIAKRY